MESSCLRAFMLKAFVVFMCMVPMAHAVDINQSYTPVEKRSEGLSALGTGTVVYALNQALTGTSSSVIDLGSFTDVWVTITNTSGTGAALVDTLWSNTPTAATFTQMYTIKGPGTEPLRKKGRYVKFRNSGGLPTNRVSLFYDPVTVTPVTVVINQGITVAGAVGVTSNAYPIWVKVSTTTRTVSSPIALNLTTMAGTAGAVMLKLEGVQSNSSGFFWQDTNSSTTPMDKNFGFYSMTTTPVILDFMKWGAHLHLSQASSTDISATASIGVYLLQQYVPPVVAP